MFKALSDFLKKKEFLLHGQEPVVYDADQFFRTKNPLLYKTISSISFEHGVITIGVSTSPALQEIFLHKNELLASLKEKKHPVREVKTRFVSKPEKTL